MIQGWYQRVQTFHATNPTTSNNNQPNINPNISTATTTNNYTATNTNTYLHNSSITPVNSRQHHYQQQQQQQHLSPLSSSYHTRTATIPIGLDTSGSGTISGLNSMLGSPMLDSLSLGMNLSAFSSPQPSGSMNTTSGRFSPNNTTNTANAQSSDATSSYTNTRGVAPTVSMDSYDTHHTLSFNNTANYNNYHNYQSEANYSDANSRLHSAADIILQAATRDMNSGNYINNIGQSGTGITMGGITKDNASMSNSNNGYSSYDEKEHSHMNQSNNTYDNNRNDSNNNNDSDYSSDTSSRDSSTSNSNSDEHNSTDLLIGKHPCDWYQIKAETQTNNTHYC